MSWRRDQWLWSAVLTGLFLRFMPLYIWGFGAQIRDEAQYINLGRAIVDGRGLINPQDWLWAPAYPYLIAFFQWVFPVRVSLSLPPAQAILGALTCVAMYHLTWRAMGSQRAGRMSAWMYALHPTIVFFSGRLWCESVYGPLLIGAVWSVLWARDGSWRRAAVPGFLLGLCVLMRGVATYLPPVLVLAFLWPTAEQGWREAWTAWRRHALAFFAAVVVTVSPYSTHASLKHGGLIISDATIGNLMFLGNNEFDPITFDYGNGVLRMSARGAHTKSGRRPCPHAPPTEWNECEVSRGMEWIKEHPLEFVGRAPVRTAQLVNPHSFLTRALRWGKYNGLPWGVKEGLVLWVAMWSFFVMLGGTVGAAARARGPYAVMAIGIVGYTVVASAALYGMTRFRVPLEPLWMVFLAGLLAHPRASWAALRHSRWRMGLGVFWFAALLFHMLWFLPSGWPGFNW